MNAYRQSRNKTCSEQPCKNPYHDDSPTNRRKTCSLECARRRQRRLTNESKSRGILDRSTRKGRKFYMRPPHIDRPKGEPIWIEATCPACRIKHMVDSRVSGKWVYCQVHKHQRDISDYTRSTVEVVGR